MAPKQIEEANLNQHTFSYIYSRFPSNDYLIWYMIEKGLNNNLLKHF